MACPDCQTRFEMTSPDSWLTLFLQIKRNRGSSAAPTSRLGEHKTFPLKQVGELFTKMHGIAKRLAYVRNVRKKP